MLGNSTPVPSMDFETYSEAGMEFDELTKKWKLIQKNAKSGIGIVGAARYSEHESTEVICLAYDLLDGKGARMWLPGFEPPKDLFEHIASGRLIEAWNSSFEYLIWKNVCHARMGWPELPLNQLRDAMVKARSWSLPGGLDKVATILDTPIKKDKEGKRLINKFSKPRTPTKSDQRQRMLPSEEPEDAGKFYSYCVDDIRAEEGASLAMPDLSPEELKLWLLDQDINMRGCPVDVISLGHCADLVLQAFKQYNAELHVLTNGAVSKASELKKLKEWLEEQGVEQLYDLKKETVEDALTWPSIIAKPQAHRALEIRSIVGSASVKKIFSMMHRLTRDGTLKELFAFCGADRTGRFAGRGPQPQNLPNSGPSVIPCSCGAYYLDSILLCPSCKKITMANNEPIEWCVEAVEFCLGLTCKRDLRLLESYFGNAVAAIAGCLRGLFCASEGRELISSDYSAIEAVVLAELAGEEWRQEVFRTHGKIYEMSASKITGIPFEEFAAHKEKTGDHHPMRKKIGKTAELACFGENTTVLTDCGWKRIKDITTQDMIHDGVEFVNHDGVVSKGHKETMNLHGVRVTPDHKFYLGENLWLTTENLKESTHYLQLATDTAILQLLSSLLKNIQVDSSVLSASANVETLAWLMLITSETERLLGVTPALRKLVPFHEHGTRSSVLTESTEGGYSIDSVPQSEDVTTWKIKPSTDMGGEGYKSTLLGDLIKMNGLDMSALCLGGKIQGKPLIELIMTKGTNLETCDSSVTETNKAISGERFGLNTIVSLCQRLSFTGTTPQISRMLTRSLERFDSGLQPNRLSGNQTQEVFDVINCGKRNRFVVLTSAGPIIAHNSGYGGWIGAWKAFGADKHFNDDQEIKEAILKWRDESPAIVEFWGGQVRKHPRRWEFRRELYGLEGCAVQAIQHKGTCFSYNGISYGVKDDVLYCMLPSGRTLNYHSPLLTPTNDRMSGMEIFQISYMGWNADYKKGPIGWMRLETYSGKLTENVVQAVARDILTHAMIGVTDAGYPIVLHIHDELVSMVPHGEGSVEDYERIMGILPAWANGWPVSANGGWRGTRYRKG